MVLQHFFSLVLLTVGDTSFTLKTGDRVVFLGGGFIEQERQHGYLETRLTSRFPEAEVRFRNLGWGGDTVKGIARTGGYQNPDGFARLLKEVQEEKPTVLILGYGMNESFAGESGLADFLDDYETLLDKLAPLKARIVVISPTFHEKLGRPFPDPARHNADLQKYVDVCRLVAQDRKLHFVDLFDAFKGEKGFSTNGIHLNSEGYYLASRYLELELDFAPRWRAEITAQGALTLQKGTVIDKIVAKDGKLCFRSLDPFLFDPRQEMDLRITGLKNGRYRLVLDGRELGILPSETLNFFSVGDFKFETHWDKLRKAIVHKNELWYRRWRPFNDHSRHWGFMKGDYPLYDKEIAEAETTIARLRRPQPKTWKIEPVGDAK